jgi:hypothetical protein
MMDNHFFFQLGLRDDRTLEMRPAIFPGDQQTSHGCLLFSSGDTKSLKWSYLLLLSVSVGFRHNTCYFSIHREDINGDGEGVSQSDDGSI